MIYNCYKYFNYIMKVINVIITLRNIRLYFRIQEKACMQLQINIW